ncbi:hypothetical protein PF002_g11833 [Phytophthora fragariae]|uniref:Cyclic nucleotide-binding domain-containing protein n=1 Tax=Phytophthora fragariae TaxID=53985 RepID=A0A6A3ZCL0_9STRA|nr:hypothetical protein PF002_g11833 [Phytophthora fragariae]
MTQPAIASDSSYTRARRSLAPRRSSLHSAFDRIRRSTTLTSTSPLRSSLMRPRSNSVELLLFEVQDALDPNSSFVHVWHQLLLVCVLYEVAMLPYLVVFRDGSVGRGTAELVLVYVCELLFLSDVYVELHMGFYEGGDVTRDATKSRLRYVKSPRFVLDLVALVPVSLFPLKTSVSIAFFEMHKFLRVWRIPKYIAQLDDVYAKYFVVLKMFKVMVGILLLSHFLACVRFLFGYDENGDDHWLPHKPDHEQTARTKYLMSVFWSFGVMTGLFEGELPHTVAAFMFTIFVAICGFLLFTYLCAMFFMISKCESGQNEASEARINQFKHMLSFHNVPDELQHQAIEKDIQVALMKDTVAKVVIFEGCSDQFIIAVTSLLEMVSLPAFFVVFHSGERGDAMYFVNSGVLHVLVGGVKVKEERKGDFFGEMSIFLNHPRFATVVTTTYCTLYKLARFHLERILDGYPEYAQSIPKHVQAMEQRMIIRESQKDSPEARLAASGKMKTISRLLRKHVQTEKAKPPTIGWAVANATSKKEQGVQAQTADAKDDTASAKSDLSFSAVSQTSPPQDNSFTHLTDRVPEPIPRTPSPTADLIPIKIRSQTARPVEVAVALADNVPGISNKLAQNQQAGVTTVLPLPSSEESDRKSSLRMLPVMQMVAAQLNWKRDPNAPFWSMLLLHKAIDFESTKRMWWILALEINLAYFWFVIPTRLVFETLNYVNWLVAVLNLLMETLLWIDIYLNFNLSYMENSEKIWDTVWTARRYLRNKFAFDLLCALPHWAVGSEFFRLLRLLRMWRVKDHLKEVDEFLHLDNKRRLMLFGWLMIMLYHTFACLHFSISYVEGFSSSAHAWLPSSDLHLRQLNESFYIDSTNVTYAAGSSVVIEIGLNQYFRSLYYACYVITALGRPVEPASDVQFGAALVFMLIGFFITAIVVDNVQKRFTASAFEQKEFFSNRTRIQQFLLRQNAPLAIHKRVSAFLDFWWSAHRGAVIASLVEDLPTTIKSDIMKSICKPALQTLALLAGVRPVLNDLEQVLIDNAKFILYGQGEVIYRQGDFAGGLFFLLEGELCVIANGGAPRSIPQGSFIGTAVLDFDNNSPSYSERVTAISGCIVLFLSREHLQLMRVAFPALPDALEALEKRFLDPKFLKASEMTTSAMPSSRRSFAFAWLSDLVLDPDSGVIIAWEVWVFILMTFQCLLTVSTICFRMSSKANESADIIILLIEVIFMLDIA